MNEIYAKHHDAVDFFCVYIQEAHPSDGWQVQANLQEQVIYQQPQTKDARAAVAEACVLTLTFAMPMLLDAMTNAVDQLYAALPERLYVIDAVGRIAYRGEPGPWGFDVESWEAAIRTQIGA